MPTCCAICASTAIRRRGAMLVGDMNVARIDLDIGISDENEKRWLEQGKCSFLPEERGG